MKKVILAVYIILLISCSGQQTVLFRPEPGYHEVVQNYQVSINDITETKAGAGNANIPGWLQAYLNGGVADVEGMVLYFTRYCFIGVNEGSNFNALSKWAENYSVIQDFPRLAAARIEKNLITTATLYPDDEYGSFFETFVKKAFDNEYHDALLEDTFWIKKRIEQGENMDGTGSFTEIYQFYVFISIEKRRMQIVIQNMMAETLVAVTPTRAQNNAIRRLQQNFFTEF